MFETSIGRKRAETREWFIMKSEHWKMSEIEDENRIGGCLRGAKSI